MEPHAKSLEITIRCYIPSHLSLVSHLGLSIHLLETTADHRRLTLASQFAAADLDVQLAILLDNCLGSELILINSIEPDPGMVDYNS